MTFYCLAPNASGGQCHRRVKRKGERCAAHTDISGGVQSSAQAKRGVVARPKASKGKGR